MPTLLLIICHFENCRGLTGRFGMYAVIFRAEMKKFDQKYSETAAKLRKIAVEKYDCEKFVATIEGQQEVVKVQREYDYETAE